jgi:hypothetical protein
MTFTVPVSSEVHIPMISRLPRNGRSLEEAHCDASHDCIKGIQEAYLSRIDLDKLIPKSDCTLRCVEVGHRDLT